MIKTVISAIKNFLTLLYRVLKKRFGRISLYIRKKKAVKRFKKKIHKYFCSQVKDYPYYSNLDSFLDEENFVQDLIDYCFTPTKSSIQSLKSLASYLEEKFVERYPVYGYYRSLILNNIYDFATEAFNIVNDYSNDENLRIIIAQLSEQFSGFHEQLSEWNSNLIKPDQLPYINNELINDNATTDFNNTTLIKYYKSSLIPYFLPQESYVPRDIYTENDTPRSSLECLLENKQIILLGDPGCGKTYESLNLLKEICTADEYCNLIPIFLELKNYEVACDSIINYAKHQLSPYWGEISDQQLSLELSKTTFVFILDGVDEILDQHIRTKFFKEINDLLCSTNAYYFITSRTNPYYGDIKNVVEYKIKDFSLDQIQKQLMKNGLNPSLAYQYKDLFSNPLFLQISIDVLRNNAKGKLYNKSLLFNSYIEEVCYKRDQDKHLPGREIQNYYDIIMSIGQLAFEYFDKPVMSISEFDKIMSSGRNVYTASTICDIFRIDVFKIDRGISFVHRQFKEFFAAYYLVNKYDPEENRDIYMELMNNENWQEVIIFSVGLIDNIDKQNLILDMILTTNLKTYICCVRYKNDFSFYYSNLRLEEYAYSFLEILYNSYILILDTYFSNIKKLFGPYYSKDPNCLEGKKVCITGCISADRKLLSYWFDWKDSSECTVLLADEGSMPDLFRDMETRAAKEERTQVSSYHVNLDLSDMMGDSARQVALDRIYTDIKSILNKFNLFESASIKYERLYAESRRIVKNRCKSVTEIAEKISETIDKISGRNNHSIEGDLKEINFNGINLLTVKNMAESLLQDGYSDEELLLPQPDKPMERGALWQSYSPLQTQEYIKDFFLKRQSCFDEMIEKNFPGMKKYFSLSKDRPYKYIIHINFREDSLLGPGIMYYRISIRDKDENEPVIIVDDTNKKFDYGLISKFIHDSYFNNGKEVTKASVTSTGFGSILTSGKSSIGPLTEIVYKDIEESFKELFEG